MLYTCSHQFQKLCLEKNTLGSNTYSFSRISRIYRARKTHSEFAIIGFSSSRPMKTAFTSMIRSYTITKALEKNTYSSVFVTTYIKIRGKKRKVSKLNLYLTGVGPVGIGVCWGLTGRGKGTNFEVDEVLT